ncbi:MAG: metallophosphoesterase family protein [Anaerolineae bacterium]|nr:metallophosphoesterase family protein [Anaerolineae bacterium]
MARLLIFSDVHGNLAALNALLSYIDEDSLDGFRCLGDVVGYYGFPDKVLEAVEQLDPDFRIGNHEIGVTHDECGADLNFQAVLAAMRHRKHLMSSGKWEALRAAALDEGRQDTRHEQLDGLALSYVHATPAAGTPFHKVCGNYIRPTRILRADQQDWGTLSAHFSAAHAQNGTDLNICFVGHSHTAMIALFEGDQLYFGEATYGQPMSLDGLQGTVLINTGSVGQPRDNVPLYNGMKLAHGVVLDTAERTVTFVAAPYAVNFGRMSNALERDSFTHNMPDDLLIETYYALGRRGILRQAVENPSQSLNELRRLFDEMWQQETDRLLAMIEHPVVQDIADWAITYTHKGFTLKHSAFT